MTARPDPLVETDQKLIEGYPDEVGSERVLAPRGSAQPVQPEDTALYLRIVQDPRVPSTYAAVRTLPPGDNTTEAERTTLARAAFDRIWRADLAQYDAAVHAGDILAGLPAPTLLAVRDDLFRLAHDRDRRWWSRRLLTRLADFGPDGAAELAFLIRDADRTAHSDIPRNPHLAGIIGLCRMGSAAAAQIPAVEAMAQDGTLLLSRGANGVLAVQMLIAIGIAPKRVRDLVTARPGDDPYRPDRLARDIADALEESDCVY